MHLSPECPAEMAPDDGTDLIEAVVTCEGNLHDPDFNDRFQILLGNLKSLLYKSKEKDKIKVKKVEPWNSVRVTISIPKEAAQKLRLLAQQGSNVLKSLGILTVQLQGDQVISLTLAGQNNSPSTEIVLRQSSSDGTGSSSSFPFPLPLAGPTGPSSLVSGPSSSSNSNSSPASSSAFRSPNVVAPGGETIPVLPPPPSPSTKGSPLTPRGPFSFASMTHAAQTMQRTDNNLNSQLQQVPPTTTSSSPVAAAGSSAALSSTSTVKSNNNNNLIHNAVNSTNSPVVSSPQLTHQQSSLVGQQQQPQQHVAVTNTASKSSEQVSRFVLQPQHQLLQSQQQTNLYQQQSQSLQLQIVNVNAPPPYPGVNISSSNSVSGVLNVTGQGTVVSVSNLSSSNSSSSSGNSLGGNLNLLGSSNTLSFVGSNNNSNNIHHQQQQLQQQLLNSAILSTSGSGTITSSASVVCVGASSSLSSNANNSNLTLVRSVSSPSMMTSQQLLDDLLGGSSSSQQPMCSPLLVNLLQNNDNQSVHQQSGSSETPHQPQSGQPSIELQKQRFMLQQQHLQQLQQRKMKRVMSLDGASPEIGNLVRPPGGGGSGPASPAVSVSGLTLSSSGQGDASSAVLLPSRMTGPVNVGQPRLSSDMATTATIIQGRTIIHQGNVRVFNPGQIRAIRFGQANPAASSTSTSSIQIVQGNPTPLSAGTNQQLQQHVLQQQLQNSDLVLSNGPVQIANHQKSSGIDNTPMDQSPLILNPSSRTFISTSSANISKQFIPISTTSSTVALNQQQHLKVQSQIAGGRSVQSEISKLGPTHVAPSTPSQPAHNRNKPPKELTSSGKPRQLLINPLTGHLEPMPSESSSDGSDEEGSRIGRLQHNNNLKKVKGAGGSKRTNASKGFANSKGGVIQHRQHVTTTTTGVTVARVVKSTPDTAKAGGQSKGKSSGNATGHKKDKSAEAGEKIKLRLKLEKKEPISPAYKVDVSFVKKSEKVASSVLSSSSAGPVPGGSNSPSGPVGSPGETQPRVPPLHISLRGKNAAVVVQSSPARSSSVDEDTNYSLLATSDGTKGTGVKSGKRTNKRVRSSGGALSDVDVPNKISRPRLSKDTDDSDGLKGRLMVSMTNSAAGGSQVDSNKVSITAVQVVSTDLTLTRGDNSGASVPIPGPAVKLKTEDAIVSNTYEKQPSLQTQQQPPASVLQTSSLSLLYQHLSKKEDKPVIATTSSLTTSAVTVTTTTRSLTSTLNPTVTTTTSVLTLTSTSAGIGASASVITKLSSDVSVSSTTSTKISATSSAASYALKQEETEVKPPKDDSSSLLPPPPAPTVTSPVASAVAVLSHAKNIPKLIRENKPKELDLSSVSAPISVVPPSPGGRSTPTSKSPKPLPDLLALTATPIPIVKRGSSESPTKEVTMKSPTPPLIPVHLNQALTQSGLPSPIAKSCLLIASCPSTTTLGPIVKPFVSSNASTSPLPHSPGAKGFTEEIKIMEPPAQKVMDNQPDHSGESMMPKSVLDNMLRSAAQSLPSTNVLCASPGHQSEENNTREDLTPQQPAKNEPSSPASGFPSVEECRTKAAAGETSKVPPADDTFSRSKVLSPTDLVEISTMRMAENICNSAEEAEPAKTEVKTDTEDPPGVKTVTEKPDISLDAITESIVTKQAPTVVQTCISEEMNSATISNISSDPVISTTSSALNSSGTDFECKDTSVLNNSVNPVNKPSVQDVTLLAQDTLTETISSLDSAGNLVDEKHSETQHQDISKAESERIVNAVVIKDSDATNQLVVSTPPIAGVAKSNFIDGNIPFVKKSVTVGNEKVAGPSSKLTQSSKYSPETKAAITKDKNAAAPKLSSFDEKKTSKKVDRGQNSLPSKIGGLVKMKSSNQRLKGQTSKPKVSIGTSIDSDLPILTPAPSLRDLLEKEKERIGVSDPLIDSKGDINKLTSSLPSMSKIDAVIERAIQESKNVEQPFVLGKCSNIDPLHSEHDMSSAVLKPELVEPPMPSTVIPNAPLPFPLVLPKPPEDPNGGHGEDSGIDSMDALSEKSPNQGESPARKEIEQFISDPKEECNYEVPKPIVAEVAHSKVAARTESLTELSKPIDCVSKTDEKCVPPDGLIKISDAECLVLPEEIQADVPSVIKDDQVMIEDLPHSKIPSEETGVTESDKLRSLDSVDVQVVQSTETIEVTNVLESKIKPDNDVSVSAQANTSTPDEIPVEEDSPVTGETVGIHPIPEVEEKVLNSENETEKVLIPVEPLVSTSHQQNPLSEAEHAEQQKGNSITVHKSNNSLASFEEKQKSPDMFKPNAVNHEIKSGDVAENQKLHIDAIQELNDQAMKKEVKKEVTTVTSRLVNAKVRKSKLENIVALIGTKNIERQMQAKTELDPITDPTEAQIEQSNSSEQKHENAPALDSADNQQLDNIKECPVTSSEPELPPVIAKKSLPPQIEDVPSSENTATATNSEQVFNSDPKESGAVLISNKKGDTEKLNKPSSNEIPVVAQKQTPSVNMPLTSLKASDSPPISIVLPARATSPQKPVLEPQVKTKVRTRPKTGNGSPLPRRSDGPPKLSKATETDPRPESANPPRLEMPLVEKERQSPPNHPPHIITTTQPLLNPHQTLCSVSPTPLTALNQVSSGTRTLINNASLKTQIHSVPPTPQNLQQGVRPLHNVIQISRASPIQVTGSVMSKISSGGTVSSMSNSIPSTTNATHIPVSLAAIANAVHHATATATTGISNMTTTSSGQTLFAIHPNMTNLPANLSHLQGHHGSSITAMLPGGQKMVPVKLVTIPRQSSGPFQTIPISGIGNASRASPNLLEAVNIVANAGSSRSNSPKTIQFHQGQGTSQINLSSIQSLAGGGNLHLVPISMASGSSNPVKVLVSSPIKVQHQSLHHQPMQLVKSVMMGQPATTIRVMRPVESSGHTGGITVVSNSLSMPTVVTSKQVSATVSSPLTKLTAAAGDARIGQVKLNPGPAATSVTSHLTSNSMPVNTPLVCPVEAPKQCENIQPAIPAIVSPVVDQPTATRKKEAKLTPEPVYKHVDELEVLDDPGQNEEDDLPYEADIIHDEKDLEDVLAGCEVVQENGLDYGSELLEPELTSKSNAAVVNCVSKSTSGCSNATDTLSQGSLKSSNRLLARTRSPSPQSDVHGEDQEIIDSFTRSPSQPKLSPQNQPIEEREESPTKPDLTEGIKRLDEELSIEIPPVDLMVGSPTQGAGSGRKDQSDSGGERKSTRSTRSNTRLVSPDITAFRSDTPKPSKFTAKVDPLILRNSPKPSPTGSLKLLSPSTMSVLAVTPSSSNRSSPVNHVVTVGSAMALGTSASLSSIDKISISNKKGGKRKRQESDSSSCTSEITLGSEEKASEVDLNSRPGKRRCSENAAELIKVQIGVEDTPKRNAMLNKRLEESNKLKEAKLKKKEAMATLVEENEDDTESIESSLSSRGRGRSSRGSSEDRSSSRGSSVQRSGSVAKSITNDEPKPKANVKNRPIQKEKQISSGRDSPNQNTVKRKPKDGIKKGTKRPVRGTVKEKSPLAPSKARANVRKDQVQGQVLSNITATSVPGEKPTSGVSMGSSGTETENSRRKTRSSAAGKRQNHVDASDSDGAMKRRRISKDTKS